MQTVNGPAVLFEDASGRTKIWFCLLPNARESGRGRHIARSLLSRELNVPLSSIVFACESGTKPLLQNCPHIWFNLSICDNALMVAVSTAHDIGVDVCTVVEDFACESVAETFFSFPEQELLSKAPKSERAFEFFRLWSRKEATVKLFGLGIAKVNLCNIDASTDRVEFDDPRARCQLHAYVTDIFFGSNFRASVATAEPIMLTEMRRITLSLIGLPATSEASKSDSQSAAPSSVGPE